MMLAAAKFPRNDAAVSGSVSVPECVFALVRRDISPVALEALLAPAS
jgi:hypothetical protein